MKNLILVDASSLIYKAFYSYPDTLTTKDGTVINAVFGFSSMLLRLLQKAKPDFIAIAFDKKGPTFRHTTYQEYKGTRTKAPDSLYEQIPLIKKLLEEVGIQCFDFGGYEADDVIGSLAKQISKSNNDVFVDILTGDKDAFQLIDNKISVVITIKGISQTMRYTPKLLADNYHLTPSQIIDFKALAGDSSDNIPGVSGIGKVTAEKLLSKYKDLNGVYNNLEELKGKLQDKLREEEEVARLSYKLAEIVTDLDINYSLSKMSLQNLSLNKCENNFNMYGFTSLIPKLKGIEKIYFKEDISSNQLELF